MRSILRLRAAFAAVGLIGGAVIGLAQTVPTPAWTADGSSLSGHATGPILDARVTPNGATAATVVAVAGNPGGAELRVRNAVTGAFLWSANLGPLPEAGLPRVAFSSNTRIYFVQTDGSNNESIIGANAATGAVETTFAVDAANDDRDFYRSRIVVNAAGTQYAYQSGDDRTGAFRKRIVVRNIAGNTLVSSIIIAGTVTDNIRDFNFSPDGTELVVALATGNVYRVVIATGVDTSLGFAGNTVNRIERIPGSTTDFMVATTAGLERRALMGGALVRSYTNVPAGGVTSFGYFGTNTTTAEAYMVGVAGAFNFPTFLRVDNGDRVAQYDVRRMGEAATDSRMNAVAFSTSGSGSVVYGSNGATSPAARVLNVVAPAYMHTVTPTMFVGGVPSTGTVTLPGPAPTGGFTVNLASNNAAVTVPASVTVPAGASSANYAITATSVAADQAVNITATFPNGTIVVPITVVRVQVTDITLSGPAAQPGETVTATVTVNGAVTSNQTVALNYPAGAFNSPPATVTVMMGASTAQVTLTVADTPTDIVGNVQASINGTSDTAPFTATGVRVQSLSFDVSPVRETTGTVGTVTLNTQTNLDRTVNLTYNASGFNAPIASVMVPAGQTQATFNLTAVETTSNIAETVNAELFGQTVSTPITVETTKVVSVTVNPNPVNNATNATGTVTLNGNLPSTRAVMLVYGPAANFDVAPATVNVNGGSSSANFTFKTKPITSAFSATIDATLGPSTAQASFNVNAILLRGVEIYPYNARPGDRVFGIVRLASPAPNAMTYTVTSGAPTILANQTVNIAAGQSFGWFAATLGNATARQTVNVFTSTPGGEARSDRFYIQPAGNVFSAGRGTNFQLGDAVAVNNLFSAPAAVTNNILKIAGTNSVTHMVDTNGRVRSVGEGPEGEIGNGTSGAAARTVGVITNPVLLNIRDIATGPNFALAITTTGQMRAWGRNAENQLGDNTAVQRNSPVISANLGFVRISAGNTHAAAIDGNGNLYTWGTSAMGALGLGATANAPVPTMVPGVTTPWVAVACGGEHTLALNADGKLYAFGRNSEGQFGNGTTTSTNVPTVISSAWASEIRLIDAGNMHSMFVRIPAFLGSTILYTSGRGLEGQLGSSAFLNRNTPFTNTGYSDIVEISATLHNSMFSRANTTAQLVGAGGSGQLGLGSTINRNTWATPSSLFPVGGIGQGSFSSHTIRSAPLAARDELLMVDTTARTFANYKFSTNVTTAFTGTYTAGLTPIGAFQVTGSSAPEIVYWDGANSGVHTSQITGTTVAPSLPLAGATFGANEVLTSMGDFNQDARQDFVTVNTMTNEVRVHFWNGTMITGSAFLYTLANETIVGPCVDWNGDLRADMLVRNITTRVLTVRRYSLTTFQGANNFALANGAIPSPPLADRTVIGGGETRVAGNLDLIMKNNTSGNFERWQLSRLTIFITGNVLNPAPVNRISLNFWR
jgi:alpha-tubulin suppressor-like RCC1 family protein